MMQNISSKTLQNLLPTLRLDSQAGLYIHIPFCKKACHYCNFYFSLSTSQKDKFVDALCSEIISRKDELNQNEISTIYFGGGTPSLLNIEDYEKIFNIIYSNYIVSTSVEISTETNPENLNIDYLQNLKSLHFNRISIGIQSFVENDLITMNRNHGVIQSKLAIENATKVFDNVSVDLMFGLPNSGVENWKKNLEIATSFDIKHISTYNLTVEEKTALAKKIKQKELNLESDNTLNEMYFYTLEYLTNKGFINYEISNFGKKNHFSQHNLNYWNQTPYLGFGPSAHSYNGKVRRSNISNLNQYLSKICSKETYWEIEELSQDNLYNEFVLTRMRTVYGIEENAILYLFGEKYQIHFNTQIDKYLKLNLVDLENKIYSLTNNGKVFADYISSELMVD